MFRVSTAGRSYPQIWRRVGSGEEQWAGEGGRGKGGGVVLLSAGVAGAEKCG